MNFAIPADYTVKIKENKKTDKYLNLVRELKKNRETGCDGNTNYNWYTWKDPQRLGKGLEELEIGGRAEIIPTTAVLRSARIMIRVLKTWGDLLSLRLQWKTITYCWWEKNPEIIIIMIVLARKLSSSSSSCRAASTDIPDPLSPLLPIIHRFWQFFRDTSRILT